MSREYAKFRLDMWATGDIRRLTPLAQHLYMVLCIHPSLTYCGVVDWRPGRLAAMSEGWTVADIYVAVEELIRKKFVVVDEDTEELLVRSFIRNDEVMKQPRLAVSMVNAFGAVASATLRGVIVHELNRLWDEDQDRPEKDRDKGWRKVDGTPGRALALLDLPAIDPADLAEGLPEDLGEGLGQDLPQGLGEGLGQTLPNVSPRVSGDLTATATATATSNEVAVSDSHDDGQPTLIVVRTEPDIPEPDPVPKKSRRRPSRPIPDDFEITDDMRAWLVERNYVIADAQRQTERMIRWAKAADKRYVDWVRTWENWIDSAVDKGDVRKRPSSSSTTSARGSGIKAWEKM